MKKYLLSLVMFCMACSCSFCQTSSQTRTANYFFDGGIHNYVQSGAQYVAADDNSYAYTKRITSTQRVYLILQDFRFTIPSDAVIENVVARVRRFKLDRGQLKDCLVHLLTNINAGDFGHYGVEMANTKDLWPGTEAGASYAQSGSGSNGILNMETHTTGPYEWTPALINDPAFGLYLLTNFPNRGNVYVYFDQVEITVEFSQPVTIAGRSREGTGTAPFLKEPLVYPNPFTTKTNIQFTATESGKAVVELFNYNGAKIRTLFSGNVVQGQVYTITVGDAQLPKGIYFYRVSNGKQNFNGRVIKVQ